MKSLWNDEAAAAFSDDDLGMRVYSSRLLGSEENLVMHGGGNTSVKATTNDFFGRALKVLYVKGSGWDLKTIEKPGFPAIKLQETQMLAELETLSDTDMTQQLRVLMLDPSAPSPSV
jgi:rhamnose utilization protein RhaD (predicted bifunctional aldolase and dehydrogenase)